MTSAESTRPGRGPVAHIVHLAIPLALSQLGHGVMSIVDTAFVGRVSAADLAGVSLGNAMFFTVAVATMGVVLGIEPMVSQAVGAGDRLRAFVALSRGLVLCVFATVIGAGVLGLALLALPHVGVDESVLPPARGYVLARMPGLLFFLVFFALRGYLQGHDVTRPVVVAVVIANLVNVLADVVFVFGDEGLSWLYLPAMGMPALGAAGAGWATTLVLAAQLLVLWPSVKRLRPTQLDDGGPSLWVRALERSGLMRIVRVGLPMGLQFAFEVAFFSSVSFLMGRISAVQLAAHQVAITIASVPFHCCLGIGSATAVVVGQRIGAGDPAGTLRAGLGGIGIGAAFQAVFGASFLLFAEAWAHAFTNDPDVIGGASVLVRIAGAFALSDGIQAIASGALRGAGDTAWPFAIHLCAHWLFGMPTALLLAFTFELGAAGMWWGLTTGLTISALLLVVRFVRRARVGYRALEHSA